MPIYEYACQACEHEFETIQKMSEDLLVDCPECGEPKLRKRVSAAVFRLKGGGWYETDFKSGNKKNVAGESGGDSGDSSSESKSESKSESQSESKSESKSEPKKAEAKGDKSKGSSGSSGSSGAAKKPGSPS